MHNNIMAVGSRDHPPMLATGRYPQWRSWFLRYIDTRPNGEALRKCILSGPYIPTIVLVQDVEATDDSSAIPEHTTVETPINMSPKNKAHFEAEKEAVHLILTGIRDEIYSTVDACQTAQEIWEAIERLQQGESLNIQDVKTNLFWEFDLRYDGNECDKGIMSTKIELTQEQSQQGVSNDVLYKNDDHSRQFGKQRMVNVVGAREKVGSPVVQQSGIQCFNCKVFGHFAKECKKPKRVKDSAYHKEKMLLCKQAEQGVPLQAEQYDWLADTDEEVDEHELEAHYSYMAKIQKVPTADLSTDSEPLEQVQTDAGYNVFANDLQLLDLNLDRSLLSVKDAGHLPTAGQPPPPPATAAAGKLFRRAFSANPKKTPRLLIYSIHYATPHHSRRHFTPSPLSPSTSTTATIYSATPSPSPHHSRHHHPPMPPATPHQPTLSPHHGSTTTAGTTAIAVAFLAAAAAVVGCGWWIGHHRRGVVRRQTTIVVAIGRWNSHHSRTMWCRAVAAQPLGMPRCAQPFDATTVVATEPAVATTSTTAAPWRSWACGGDPPFC
nr:hypothetical protein [Tanacetum cinerariifolium]